MQVWHSCRLGQTLWGGGGGLGSPAWFARPKWMSFKLIIAAPVSVFVLWNLEEINPHKLVGGT